MLNAMNEENLRDLPATDVFISPQTFKDPTEVTSYWTKERMSEALPLPLPTLDKSPVLNLLRDKGEPFFSNPQGPDNEVDDFFLAPSTSLVENTTVSPYQAVGKIFGRFGGQGFVGSGFVVGESTIATAGHCVYNFESGEWASDLIFLPQYRNGETIGTWTVRDIITPIGWRRDRSYEHDLGFVILSRPIRPQTGKIGLMANFPPNQGPYTAIGYPAARTDSYPFDGKLMWQSVGNYAGGSSVVRAENNMTGGCSGGPWAVFKDNKWLANGVNSHNYSDDPNSLYSPYFGDNIVSLLEWMRNNGGD
jgi:V8-like Glu-specific endopeptidase